MNLEESLSLLDRFKLPHPRSLTLVDSCDCSARLFAYREVSWITSGISSR